jgi:endogenous inhibitor of DNA gyrase (YacG/DUF329 family)
MILISYTKNKKLNYMKNNTLKFRKLSKAGKCPICKKLSTKQSNPFCSTHCANVDLSHWFHGKYSAPSFEDPDGSEIIRLSDEE